MGILYLVQNKIKNKKIIKYLKIVLCVTFTTQLAQFLIDCIGRNEMSNLFLELHSLITQVID